MAADQRDGLIGTSVRADKISFNPGMLSFQEDLGHAPCGFPGGSALSHSMRSGALIQEFTYARCFSERWRVGREDGKEERRRREKKEKLKLPLCLCQKKRHLAHKKGIDN